MPAQIQINCPIGSYQLSADWFENTIEKLLNQCQLAGRNVSLLIVDDREMQKLNREYRNIDTPTNVLSFPFAEGADPAVLALPVNELGDIVISLETAKREAIEYGQSMRERTAWLLVHGLLHLLGFDHETSEADAEKMFAVEKMLLNGLVNKEKKMTKLAINVDHVATIRQARGITEPDPVTAAAICELAGASGIVIHLREDRRHIQDRDLYLLRQTVKTKLNLEMGANEEIIKIALELGPDLITLVPEKRQELTTEGGLDIVGQKKKIAKVIAKMAKKAIPVSIFTDPDSAQLAAAKEIGATFVELHTGRYCDAHGITERNREFSLLAQAAEEAHQLGLTVCAGHGLNYQNTAPVAALPQIDELSIGHAIISRAIFTGLDQAVREMLTIVQQASKD